MKLPNEQDNDEQQQAAIRDANARAILAQDHAIALRTKLEQMENLLNLTRSKLSDANHQLEMKDQRLKDIQTETKALSHSVQFLEERFDSLKKAQTQLYVKRETMIAESSAASSSSEQQQQPTSSSETTVEQSSAAQSIETTVANSESSTSAVQQEPAAAAAEAEASGSNPEPSAN